MTVDDHAALVAMGKKMATTNGYTPMQSSGLYVTDGDEIDWAYGSQHICMYTFELYPSHARSARTARFYPPDELIGPRDRPQQGRDPVPHRARRLPVLRVIGKAKAELRPAVRRLRDATAAGSPTRSAPTPRPRGALAARQPGDDGPPGGDRPVGLAGARHRRAGRRDARTRTTSTAA